MALIERTAYPRLRRLVRARELATLMPSEAEIDWANGRTVSMGHAPCAHPTVARAGRHLPATDGCTARIDRL